MRPQMLQEKEKLEHALDELLAYLKPQKLID